MSTYSERIDDAQRDAQADYEEREERALWRWCAQVVAQRICLKRPGSDEWRFGNCRDHGKIWGRLLEAIDDVPDLQVLIRKAQPDMVAFRESQMTAKEAYRW